MPIYEYKCSACGNGFEYLHFAGDDTPPRCPKCDSPQVARQLSCFSTSAGQGGGSGLGALAGGGGGHSCGSGGFS